MNNTAKPLNVIWILVDSVRNYRGAGDDRDKLEVMYELAKDAVEFKTVVTSAPSTIMAISAMMTSWPSYYIARNYDDFKYDNRAFYSLTDVLRENGYTDHGIIYFRDGREKLSNLFNQVGRQHWPQGLSYAKENWTNDDVTCILFNLLDAGIQEPFFLYAHYNCRWDPDTSDKVALAIEKLKDVGLYENSLLVVCSDHGYPDPSRGYTPEGLKRLGFAHDLILSDDNILIPLYIRYPGAPVLSIDTTVSILDMMPTVLDILGIELPVSSDRSYHPWGRSLVPLLQGQRGDSWEKRKVRVDGRFLAQAGRLTAIRGNRYKYVVHHDDGKEEFYDLIEDPWEQHNLAHSPNQEIQDNLISHRQVFEQSELDAVEFQFEYVLTKFKQQIAQLHRKQDIPSGGTVLVFGACQSAYLKLLVRVIDTLFADYKMDVLVENELLVDKEWLKFDRAEVIDNREKEFVSGRFVEQYPQVAAKHYDLVIVPLANSSADGYEHILSIARRLNGRNLLAVDYNMQIHHGHNRKWYFAFKVLYAKRQFYFQEPALLFIDLTSVVRGIVRRFWRRVALSKR